MGGCRVGKAGLDQAAGQQRIGLNRLSVLIVMVRMRFIAHSLGSKLNLQRYYLVVLRGVWLVPVPLDYVTWPRDPHQGIGERTWQVRNTRPPS